MLSLSSSLVPTRRLRTASSWTARPSISATKAAYMALGLVRNVLVAEIGRSLCASRGYIVHIACNCYDAAKNGQGKFPIDGRNQFTQQED